LDGARLDRAAADLFPDYSRARLQAWIEEGRLIRNGAPAARTRDAVRAGDHLQLTIPGLPDAEPRAQAIALDVVYADDAIAVIDKPVGLIVHPGAGAPDGTLQNALLHRFPQTALVPRAGIVHRLDKDTSGLLVVALDLKAHARLVEAMAAREIRREYEAVVNGVLTAGGTVDAPIGRDPRNRLRMAVTAGGRHAVTHYRVLERFACHSHLRVRLETGRTHQIRVHMAHIRHAIVGDTLYGGNVQRGTALSDALRLQLRAFPRQALHACELALRHPVDGTERVFQSSLPDDMCMLLAALRAG
jgi:23S rRNA pseudouridine1911/1915/1917 synthase